MGRKSQALAVLAMLSVGLGAGCSSASSDSAPQTKSQKEAAKCEADARGSEQAYGAYDDADVKEAAARWSECMLNLQVGWKCTTRTEIPDGQECERKSKGSEPGDFVNISDPFSHN